VLFYDRKLSRNNLTSCGSCHQQGRGFADPNKLSIGFQGGTTGRHSMGLSNARFYNRGRFFWDERAASLEVQVVTPIQDSVEMGMTLSDLVTKLSATDYYPPLFQAAFGTPDVTSDRISKALAQFVRSMVTYQSKYDSAFVNGTPNFQAVLTASEVRGQQLFGPGINGQGRSVRCDRCHATNAQVAPGLENTGLDAISTDAGAGLGRFKVPSLRNVAVRSRFMHDGRFTSLEEAVQFYNAGVQNNPNLSPLLRNQDGTVTRLNLTAQEAADLVAFLQTLTDNAFLNDPKFSDPFQ
jgi:cytochrome c peroxidase